MIAGLDEVGTGSLVGPLVIAVTAFSRETPLFGVADSKKLTPKKREKLFPAIVQEADYVNFGWTSNWYIDRHGLSKAWQQAATMALQGAPEFDVLLVDGVDRVLSHKYKQQPVIKGDTKHWQISAASIVAKVIRDRAIADIGQDYPLFRWEKNAGYGTKDHCEIIRREGITPYHRITYLKNIASESTP